MSHVAWYRASHWHHTIVTVAISRNNFRVRQCCRTVQNLTRSRQNRIYFFGWYLARQYVCRTGSNFSCSLTNDITRSARRLQGDPSFGMQAKATTTPLHRTCRAFQGGRECVARRHLIWGAADTSQGDGLSVASVLHVMRHHQGGHGIAR